MDHKEVGELWDANADDWTKLVRLGYDVMRHQIIAPAFMAMLPEVSGLRGLDIVCGEGANTRLLAQEGEKMAGIDISSKFVRYAQEAEAEAPLGVCPRIRSWRRKPPRNNLLTVIWTLSWSN